MADQMMPPQEAIQRLLSSMGQVGASDLHLKVHYPPYYRIAKLLRKVEMPPLPDSKYIQEMLIALVPEELHDKFYGKDDLDFSARVAEGDRYRINVFRSANEVHAAIRRVQSAIPSFDTLNLPDIYRDIVAKSLEGLVLISGVTGCGKSSTMAAMLEHINTTRSMHVITIEDRIEFLFKPKKSIISQREIGIDVADYAEALRFVVRQDPDCIMIGELRDRETMLAAIQAAETGHLVLGSLHCPDAPQTFTRILEFFPQSQHAFVRSTLAAGLRGILCQKLLPGIEEGEQYPATEVLINNTVVKDKIVREEDDDLAAIIAGGREDGMRSFTTSLCELVETEKIHFDTAMDYAPNREALTSAVKGISTASEGLIGRLRPER